MRAIAQAAAAACTEPPPSDLEDLLTDLGRRDGTEDDAPSVDAREQARSALLRVEELLRDLPIALEHALQLREQLERLRIGAHEVRELELLEALDRGTVVLPASDPDGLRRLLGAHGTDAHVRLELSADAPREDLEDVARRQLEVWEGRAQHPAANRATRWAAEVLIRTCEELLAPPENLHFRPSDDDSSGQK